MGRLQMWNKGIVGLTAVVLGVLGPSVASADQCAPAYVRAAVSAPLDGDDVARNVHFRVSEHTGCGEALPSAPPEYRIIGAKGPVEFERAPSPYAAGELLPAGLLPVGSVTVEARNPRGDEQWGPWHPVQTVEVADRLDEAPPSFDGILRARATVVQGAIALSPCEVMEGPVVKTVLTFRLAHDGPTPHDELLYVLDRSPDGIDWSPFRAFRPDVMSSRRGRFSWEDEDDFDHRWTYRMRVVDATGHETVGPKLGSVKTPPIPSGSADDPWSSGDHVASATPPGAKPPGDEPPLSPAWQWGAAFGTLFGAGLASIKRRSSVR